MNLIERNIAYSFNLARKDIMALQNDVIQLAQNQQKLAVELEKVKNENKNLKEKLSKAPKKEIKVIKKITQSNRRKTHYIASKTGSKFHVTSCPFGQNIKPKMKIKFLSKTKALNQGLKPCACIK